MWRRTQRQRDDTDGRVGACDSEDDVLTEYGRYGIRGSEGRRARYLGYGDVEDLGAERQRQLLNDRGIRLVWVELFFFILKLCLRQRLRGSFGRLVIVRVDES